ncbi:glycosyltransferase family 87 protein [Crocinitomix catalasitica]|uniref:glycosyltransferase family 87 protein n=1 Tax=Crocinitomix catalasitica TaxID=184607 RepID=UPI0006868814|nr:glycosyltransferase family 87 protein [Crocinitomix catalasitica]
MKGTKLRNFIGNNKWIFSIYLVLALITSFQAIISERNSEEEGTLEYNNYTIFKSSYYHLKQQQDLYQAYPQEYWDLYKYTPTFAAVFSVFAVFPDWIGLTLWLILNTVILVFAIYSLPSIDNYKKGLILVIVIIELVTSIQNEQSNPLIAGLIILAFSFLEKRNYLWASLFIMSTVFIKLFGIVALVLFLFYPQKWKLALYSIMWFIVLSLLPFLFVDWVQYAFLLESFWHMLSNDFSTSYGYSVMGWLNTWFNLDVNKNIIVLFGALFFMVPFASVKVRNSMHGKLLILSSLLIWLVIFNHKAESPTFIIAMLGVAIWFVISPKNILNTSLFLLAVLFTMLSPTDIFPREFRETIIKPFVLKGVPCILIWIKIQFDLFYPNKDLPDILALDKEKKLAIPAVK